MGKQKLLTPGDLLDNEGNLTEAGYAYGLVKKYDRNAIKVNAMRIKEWDYYYVGNYEYGLAFTIADNGYMSLVSASFMDFNNKTFVTDSEMKAFTFGKLGLPSSSAEGDVTYSGNRVDMSFCHKDGGRVLTCEFKRWGKKEQNFKATAILTDEPRDSMVIATPFNKPRHFYYNQKINCMTASADFCIDGEEKHIDGCAVLDWGRGVWTYKNTWYWSSLNTTVGKHKVGFNLGYGFGDTGNATENMIFFDGIATKVDEVVFNIPVDENGKDNFLEKWTIVSNDGKINLTFEPILDRADKINAVLLATDQHQVFGKFYGDLVVDETVKVTLCGKVGFAEKVFNKW